MKTRLESMSKLHCIGFIITLVVVVIVFFGASFKAGTMFICNNGDTYVCPKGSNTTIDD